MFNYLSIQLLLHYKWKNSLFQQRLDVPQILKYFTMWLLLDLELCLLMYLMYLCVLGWSCVSATLSLPLSPVLIKLKLVMQSL